MNVRTSLICLAVFAGPLEGQESPTILTHATGQVDAAADHAVMQVGAVFTGQTATAASERLANTLSAVIVALTQMGFDPDSLPTTYFAVQPRMDYETNTIRGYDARGGLEVTIRDIESTGTVIDAVVAAGANQLGSLQFRLENQRSARDSALTLAVAAARRDAEVLARAADGRLGHLLELGTGPDGVVGGGFSLEQAPVASFRSQGAAVPVTPGAVTISVAVSAKWEFLRN